MENKSFEQRLVERSIKSQSLLCIGLDPKEESLEEAEKLCRTIIEATSPMVAAYKPNIAYFERFGPVGLQTLLNILAYVPSDIPIILDAKRGDIDITAKAYASAAFSVYGADAVTVNPYMGVDSIQPFVSPPFEGKGVFVLCKTSNPSSKDIQEQRLASGQTVFEKVAELCGQWTSDLQVTGSSTKKSTVGLVVGATDIQALQTIRRRHVDACVGRGGGAVKQLWILCPGVGAQGGNLQDACRAGLRPEDGSGLLITVSRGILASGHTHAAIAGEAAALRDAINVCVREKLDEDSFSPSTVSPSLPSPSPPASLTLTPLQREVIETALDCHALMFGSFTLKSGRTAPYFFNMGAFASGKAMQTLCR